MGYPYIWVGDHIWVTHIYIVNGVWATVGDHKMID